MHMAGWVKIAADLRKSPDFWRLAKALELSRGDRKHAANRALSAIVELWMYAAEEATTDGVIECHEVEDLGFIGVDVDAILPTLEEIGWLKRVPGGVVFDSEVAGLRHSVSTRAKRERANDRVRRHRGGKTTELPNKTKTKTQNEKISAAYPNPLDKILDDGTIQTAIGGTSHRQSGEESLEAVTTQDTLSPSPSESGSSFLGRDFVPPSEESPTLLPSPLSETAGKRITGDHVDVLVPTLANLAERMRLDRDAGAFVGIEPSDIEGLKGQWPDLNVEEEIAACAAWHVANRTNRKTWHKTLVAWFGKARKNAQAREAARAARASSQPSGAAKPSGDAVPWYKMVLGPDATPEQGEEFRRRHLNPLEPSKPKPERPW
jgi:hypothetical protein